MACEHSILAALAGKVVWGCGLTSRIGHYILTHTDKSDVQIPLPRKLGELLIEFASERIQYGELRIRKVRGVMFDGEIGRTVRFNEEKG